MHLQNRILDILNQLDPEEVTDVQINRRNKFVTVTCSLSFDRADKWEVVGATLHIDITDDDILPDDDDDGFTMAVINGERIAHLKEAA